MANSIEKMLEINSRITNGETSRKSGQQQYRAATQTDLDRIIEGFDKQVYGPMEEVIVQEGQMPRYDADTEMKRLKEIENNGRAAVDLEGKNIPRKILESILENPLDMPTGVVDSRMQALEERIAGKGIKAAVDVMHKVDKHEAEARAKLNEQLTPRQTSNNGAIDYNLIKLMIENAIDKKFNEFKQNLNESANRQMYAPSTKILSFKDNFYFVDNDDNVFECVMKYKGKNKKRTR